jgi:hypothetical protein
MVMQSLISTCVPSPLITRRMTSNWKPEGSRPVGATWVALRFTGHQTTLRVNGPWGVVSAFSATTSDNPVATALWDGSAGETLFFTFSFTGGIIGFLKSIQMHLLA